MFNSQGYAGHKLCSADCRITSEATETMPATPGIASTRSSQAAPDMQEQASSLLNYAWKHVFEQPGLPVPLR